MFQPAVNKDVDVGLVEGEVSQIPYEEDTAYNKKVTFLDRKLFF